MPKILSVLICVFFFIGTISSGVIIFFIGIAFFFVMLKSNRFSPNEYKFLLVLTTVIATDILFAFLSYIRLRHLGFFPKRSPA